MAEFTSEDGRIKLQSVGAISVSMRTPEEGALLTADGEETLSEIFEASEFTLLQIIDTEAETEEMPLSADGLPSEGIEISVEPEDGFATALLVESEGVFQWVFPNDSNELLTAGRRSEDVFFLDLIGADENEPQFVSGLWNAAKKRIFKGAAVYVLKYAIGRGVEFIGSRIDGKGPFGLFTVSGNDPTNWTPEAGLSSLSGDKGRVLLLVHGTFSTTEGSFGDTTKEGVTPHFLDNWANTYDHVIGFDHKTLGESVVENAKALAKALKDVDGSTGVTIDAIGYSRGGLILRHLIEKHWPEDLNAGQFVYVGAPLSGTKLASPRNWNRLLDLYSTFAGQAAQAAATIGGQPQAGMVIKTILSGLGTFAKLVVSQGVDPKYVPGLASMVPSGPHVNAFDAQPGLGGQYHSVASNFEPGPADSIGNRVKLIMADLFMDELFQVDNDLVVDTRSMSTLPVNEDGPYEISGNDALVSHAPGRAIFHTTYFDDPESLKAISRFLGL